jgi:hypothetical protein
MKTLAFPFRRGEYYPAGKATHMHKHWRKRKQKQKLLCSNILCFEIEHLGVWGFPEKKGRKKD